MVDLYYIWLKHTFIIYIGCSKFLIFSPSHDFRLLDLAARPLSSFACRSLHNSSLRFVSFRSCLPLPSSREYEYASIVNTSWSSERVALRFRIELNWIELKKRGETEIRTADPWHRGRWWRPLNHDAPLVAKSFKIDPEGTCGPFGLESVSFFWE